jgi:signal transduction histidine kinase
LTKIATEYLLPERVKKEQLVSESSNLFKLKNIKEFVDCIPTAVLVLNMHRQTVFTNETTLCIAAAQSMETIIGLRPGEILGCIHSNETEGGCGTTEFCRTCGAARAIVASQCGLKDVQECHITTRDGRALDFRVWATPFETSNNKYVVFAFIDISHEKMRRELERVFFHDIMNSISSISSAAQLLSESPVEESAELVNIVNLASNRVIDEIRAQRNLAKAENGELTVNIESLNSLDLLVALETLYRRHEAAKGKKIQIDEQSSGVAFTSDKSILMRVLGNLVKNALEASAEGRTVTIGCTRDGNKVEFSIHNEGCIPREVQLQMFQRFFSTKGVDRGLGTYSVKLLSERYLNGQVTFESYPSNGTTFHVSLPIN